MCGGVTSAIGPAAGAVRRQCQYVLTRVRHHSLHRSNDGSRFGRLQRARIERHRRACCASVLRLRRRIVGFLFSISCGPCLLQGAPPRACGGFLCCLLRVQLLDLLGDAWRLQAAALVRRKAVRRGRHRVAAEILANPLAVREGVVAPNIPRPHLRVEARPGGAVAICLAQPRSRSVHARRRSTARPLPLSAPCFPAPPRG